MRTKTARVQPNGHYEQGEKPRYLVIFEEKSQGVQIELKIKHYANEKTAQRAAAKYLADA